MPTEQRQFRKMWREKSKKKQDREKITRKKVIFYKSTHPSTPLFSRVHISRSVATHNRRRPRAIAENVRPRICQTAMERSMRNIKKSDRIRNKLNRKHKKIEEVNNRKKKN